MAELCQTKSLTPLWVTITFALLSLIMLIYTVTISRNHLKSTPTKGTNNKPDQHSPANPHKSTTINEQEKKEDDEATATEQVQLKINKDEATDNEERTVTIDEDIDNKSEWEQLSTKKKIKLLAKDVWGRKAVYLPLISHLSDTATDFAAVVEFGIVASAYSPNQCGGVNVWYLFTISILCMLMYRVLSSYIMYQITNGSWRRTLLQLMDIELYQILYFSHRWGLNSSSSPQRLISVLEAVFEAAPQAVIQMVYLMFTGSGSGVVIASAVLSFVNLTLSITSDDAKMLQIRFPSKCGEKDEDNNSRLMQVAILYMFRVFDVVSRLLCYSFLWYYVSGYLCFSVLLVEFLIVVAIYIKLKRDYNHNHLRHNNRTDVLLGIVAVPLSFGDILYEDYLENYLKWCQFQSVALNLLIWICIFAQKRKIFGTQSLIGSLWIFCSVAMLMKWLVKYMMNDAVGYHYDQSKERTDLDTLVEQEKYEDAMELIMFIANDISCLDTAKQYGRATKKTLIDIAVAAGNERFFNVVFEAELERSFKNMLIIGVETRNYKFLELALNHTLIDFRYLMKRKKSRIAGEQTVFGIAIGDMKATKLLIQCMDRLADKEADGERKRANVLNEAWPEHDWTAFHVAAKMQLPLEWFEMLYAAYRSDNNAKEALSKVNNGPTVMQIVETEYRGAFKSNGQQIKQFITNKLSS